MMENLPIGTPVLLNCVEGFGGYGFVVETRDSVPGCSHKVRATDGRWPDCWAHDGELADLRAGDRKPVGYDSRPETYAHIQVVQKLLGKVIRNMLKRSEWHDASKLGPPEREAFDKYTPRLAGMTYGSEEYKACLAAMAPALAHHYADNPHHPEHYPDGIRGMSLMDLTEMLCDWLAATGRHGDGDIRKSIDLNQKRFGYSDELRQVLLNTLAALE